MGVDSLMDKLVRLIGADVEGIRRLRQSDQTASTSAQPNRQPFHNPLTDTGDIVYGGSFGQWRRRQIGTEGLVLCVEGGVPVWGDCMGACDCAGGGVRAEFVGTKEFISACCAYGWSATYHTAPDPNVSADSDSLDIATSGGTVRAQHAEVAIGPADTPFCVRLVGQRLSNADLQVFFYLAGFSSPAYFFLRARPNPFGGTNHSFYQDDAGFPSFTQNLGFNVFASTGAFTTVFYYAGGGSWTVKTQQGGVIVSSSSFTDTVIAGHWNGTVNANGELGELWIAAAGISLGSAPAYTYSSVKVAVGSGDASALAATI